MPANRFQLSERLDFTYFRLSCGSDRLRVVGRFVLITRNNRFATRVDPNETYDNGTRNSSREHTECDKRIVMNMNLPQSRNLPGTANSEQQQKAENDIMLYLVPNDIRLEM